MSSEFAIKVESIGKNYHIYDKPHHRLLQMLARGKKTYYRDFWAVKDVSFSIKKGETVGIIGRNGSGKSTLLQMICGTLTPTAGSIEVNGRVAALLELGAGFNPEFSGRENVYMAASLYGLKHEEIEGKMADIIAFADISDFMDQPVKTYSSGMYVRLAFAVIAHVDADILVIDEALAVGDIFFTQKCMRFIQHFQEKGGTLLFVSHDMGTVMNICQSAVMLFAGAQRKAITGTAETLCKEYLSQIYDDPERHQQVKQQYVQQEQIMYLENSSKNQILTGVEPENNLYVLSPFRADADSFGEGGATIIDVGFFAENGERLMTIEGGETVRLIIYVLANKTLVYPAIGMMIKDRLGQYLYTAGTDESFRHHHLVFNGRDNICITFQFNMPILSRGVYTINVAVAEGLGDAHIQHHWIHDAIKIEAISGSVVHGLGEPLNMTMTMEFLPQAQEVTK